jgi:hypothetical protein
MNILMRKFFRTQVLASVLVVASSAVAGNFPARGLWVGEATLNRVNETVVGIDAANHTVAPDPSVTTPVASPAHLRIIFHVDGQGQVRLLKSVAILSKSTNDPADLALVTDETLYPQYASIGRRISSAAFDFGDNRAVDVLNEIAGSAAAAAAAGADPTNAANQTIQSADLDSHYNSFVHGSSFSNAVFASAASATIGAISRRTGGGTVQQITADAFSAATNDARVVSARTNAVALQAASLFPDSRYVFAVDSVSSAAASAAAAAAAANSNYTAEATGLAATNAAALAMTNAFNAASPVSSEYDSFITSSKFLSSANIAGAAAKSAAAQAIAAGNSSSLILQKSKSAAVKALTDQRIFAAADVVVVNELEIAGDFAANGTLNGTIYLGASHPTNPFRHRQHPSHSIGYPITRALTIHFDAPGGTNAFDSASFGVDRITGTYREEISGLHKPLGPNQDIGLIAEGTITLDRISLIDTLNQ